MNQHINMNIPSGGAGGVFADFVGVWHTEQYFSLDFAALTGPPQQAQDEHGNPVIRTDAELVARVRIHPSQMFEIMKALEQQLSAWEIETGQRQGPTEEPSAE